MMFCPVDFVAQRQRGTLVSWVLRFVQSRKNASRKPRGVSVSVDNRASDIRRTQTNYLRTIEADLHWFKLAVQRNLLEEAAEVVYDWVEDWIGRQADPKDEKDFANFAQIVAAAGIEAAPYIEALTGPIADIVASGRPANWQEMSPETSPPAATQSTIRTNGLPAPTPIEQACHAVYQKRRRNAGALQFQRQ